MAIFLRHLGKRQGCLIGIGSHYSRVCYASRRRVRSNYLTRVPPHKSILPHWGYNYLSRAMPRSHPKLVAASGALRVTSTLAIRRSEHFIETSTWRHCWGGRMATVQRQAPSTHHPCQITSQPRTPSFHHRLLGGWFAAAVNRYILSLSN
jgi:hypothetical protein